MVINVVRFITEDGAGLTRQTFAALLDSILSKLHLDSRNYNTHSFRSGAATTAAQAQIPDASIKMMGRWRSDAYKCYIKTPEELAKLSKQLNCQLPMTGDIIIVAHITVAVIVNVFNLNYKLKIKYK